MHNNAPSVLFAAAECAPFAKVGGLGDVIGSLPAALSKLRMRVAVVLPKYKFISRKLKLVPVGSGFSVQYKNKRESCRLYRAKKSSDGVEYLFIGSGRLNTDAVYSPIPTPNPTRGSKKIHPDIDRFSFFSHAVVEAYFRHQLPYSIIHCHDWHTALIPSYLDQKSVVELLPNIKTAYTIHNLGNQGIAPRRALKHFGLAKDTTPSLMEDYYDLDAEMLNLMKLGVLSADIVTTVSRAYAKEIMTEEYAGGLAQFLLRRKRDVYGIINGIDTVFFNPANDKLIFETYTSASVRRGKLANKNSLQKELGLPQSNAPLYGIVTRIVAQKGFDILLQALERFLNNDVQFVLLGTGEPRLEKSMNLLAKKFQKKCSVRIGFDAKLAQKIYAASDFFLMPSHFEPCGLGQMIAMRYGSIPVVRETGGLKDTVKNNLTGITFTDYTADALADALKRSLALYRNTRACYTIIKYAMKKDFSWGSSALKYLKLYKSLL